MKPILFFILFSFAEATRHAFLIVVRKISPNKEFSFVFRAFIGAIFIVYELIVFAWPAWFLIPLYILTDWCIHDYYLNIWLSKPFYYLNSTGPIDTFQNNNPNAFVWFCFKTTALLGLLGCYIFNTVSQF